MQVLLLRVVLRIFHFSLPTARATILPSLTLCQSDPKTEIVLARSIQQLSWTSRSVCSDFVRQRRCSGATVTGLKKLK